MITVFETMREFRDEIQNRMTGLFQDMDSITISCSDTRIEVRPKGANGPLMFAIRPLENSTDLWRIGNDTQSYSSDDILCEIASRLAAHFLEASGRKVRCEL